jgi:hypothetical protein
LLLGVQLLTQVKDPAASPRLGGLLKSVFEEEKGLMLPWINRKRRRQKFLANTKLWFERT